MLSLSVPWWELAVRGVVIYFFLLVLLRLSGNRQVGQLTTFDLVLLLVLSNGVQNAMNAGDNSLTGGLILAGVLVALHLGISRLVFRSKTMEHWLEGQPLVLIHNGKLFDTALARASLTRHQLLAALREAGCARIEDAHAAILEENGNISVITRDQAGSGRPA